MAKTTTASERKLHASIAAHASWANTADPQARTAAARRTFRDSFQDVIDPDHRLDPIERARRGEHAYKAHMKALALKSARSRRLKTEARQAAARARVA